MPQLKIHFPTATIECDQCHKATGLDPRNEYLFNGFWCADSNQFICWSCQDEYYKMKQGNDVGVTYSEMPATFHMIQNFTKKIITSL